MGIMEPTDPAELKKIVDHLERQLDSARQNLLNLKKILELESLTGK